MSRHVLSVGPLNVAAVARELTVTTLALVDASTSGGSAVRADGLSVAALELELAGHTQQSRFESSALALEALQAEVQLDIAGASGITLEALSVGQVRAARAAWSVDSRSLAAQLSDLRISGVAVHDTRIGDGARAHVSADALEASVALDVGALALRGRLHVRGLRVDLSDDDVRLGCDELWASDLSVETPKVKVRAGEVRLPSGLELGAAGDLHAPALRSARVELEVRSGDATDSSSRAGSERASDGAADDDGEGREDPARDGAAEARARRAAQLEALDNLLGDVDLHCDVDATLPIVGRRRAQHHFVLPIVDGAIDFRALEGGLSALEDAALDFEVEGDRLVLEKDVIPLVTFDNETLLSWPLDPSGQAMARAGRVRLRTLLAPKVHVELGGEGPPPLSLHSLDVDLRSVALQHEGCGRLPLGPLCIALGDGQRKGVEALQLSGRLSHRQAGPAPAGEIELSCEAINGAIHHLQVGARLLAADAVRIDDLSRGVLSFVGLRPHALELAGRLDASEITLR